MKIVVGVSNRHIHLTKETYDKLFTKELTVRNQLLQPNEFASNETLTISVQDKSIDNVRIIGPFRKYNQVEISRSDAYLLGINPPVRKSGDLENSETITISNGVNKITLENSCIIANRHLHMSSENALKYGIKDNQKLAINILGEKSGIIDVYAKILENATLELHLDRDDANAFLLKTGDEAEWKI